MLTICGIASNSYDLDEIKRCWFNAHLANADADYNIDGTRVHLARAGICPETIVQNILEN